MLEINGMKFPTDRKYYTKEGAHIWIKPEGNHVKIGMDAFAAEMIGYLTYLTITKKQAMKGEAIGSFESAKFVSRFYSPLTGKIIAVNEEVLNNPRKINENPYESWIISMKPDAIENDEFLLEGNEKIHQWIAEEIKRMEDK